MAMNQKKKNPNLTLQNTTSTTNKVSTSADKITNQNTATTPMANSKPNQSQNQQPTQTPQTPAEQPTSGQTVYDRYMQTIQNLNAQKEANNQSENTLTESENNAINSKIEATNTLLDSYLETARAYQSAKVQSQFAEQNALKATNAYLKASGLQGQGISESSQVAIKNNSGNVQATLNASKNADNASMYEQYLKTIQDINAQKEGTIQNIQEENNTTIASGLESAIMEDGTINEDTLEHYMNMAKEMLANKELSNNDYQANYNAYRQYVELAKKYNSEIEAQKNAVLSSAGVTDFTPISRNGKEITTGDLTALKELLNKYSYASDQAYQNSLTALLNAEDGSVVTLQNEGKKAEYVVYGGKIYLKTTGQIRKGTTQTPSASDSDKNSSYYFANTLTAKKALENGLLQEGDLLTFKGQSNTYIVKNGRFEVYR